jgi:hypothetical protein
VPVRIIAFAVALSLLAASCGDSGDGGTASVAETTVTTPPPRHRPLAPAEVAQVDRIERRVQGYCLRASRALGGVGEAPSQAELEAALDGIDRLAELARQNPYAVLPNGVGLRLTLGDIAEDLEGENCSPEIQARIDEQLATLPAE